MRVAVIGAAGRRGRHVVGHALTRADEVIAIARAPEKIGLRHDPPTLAGADVRDRDEPAAAIDRAENRDREPRSTREPATAPKVDSRARP